MSRFSKITAWSLLLSPILQTYGWGRYDFAFILTVILALIHLFKSGVKGFKRMPKLLLVYFALWYLSHVIAAKSFGGFVPGGIFRVILVYYLFFDIIQVKYLINCYYKLALVCIGYFFLQEITFYLGIGRLPGVFHFLPISLVEDSSALFEELAEVSRSSSLFSEPAHFAQFLLPLLAISLMYFRKVRIKWVVLIGLTLLLLQSGNGLFGAAAIAAVYFISYIIKSRSRYKYLILSGVSVLIIGVGIVYINSEMGQKLLSRKDTISLEDTVRRGYAASGFTRIVRGYYVYAEYSVPYKLIGNDSQSYIKKCISSSIVSSFFDENETYMNTVQTVLCYTGIIGMAVFILLISSIWSRTTVCGKSILVTLIVLSLIAALYFTESMAMYMLLPYKFRKLGHNKCSRTRVIIKR